uniref:Palmitoyltransferase n=1 Tax=Globisporangium ultimum (strain ATCC 200006 / CBS 805.95 / DAOM BR144) TaxID=431595 RepID=K3WUY3_GLOUD
MEGLRMRTQRWMAQHRLWFLWDPAGLIIAGFAWSLMLSSLAALYASVSHWLGLFSALGLALALWFTALMAMCMWCHLAVLTTDPGFVPAKLSGVLPQTKRDVHGTDSADEDESELEEEEVVMPLHELEDHVDDGTLLVFCDECDIYRPSRAEHCHTCERCVVLHDHHCPWVNNCVGIGNHKAFLLLLLYVTVTSVYVLLFILSQRYLCAETATTTCGFREGQFPGRLGMWMLAGACVFGLFCALMLVMELYSIYLDPVFTLIADQITCRSGSKSRSRLERHVSVICGTNGMDLRVWLLPFAPRRSRHETEIVHGFRDYGGGSSARMDAEIC